MVGHTRRFNPSHQWINRIQAGEISIQQMDVETYFFRRKNINAKGEPRSGPTIAMAPRGPHGGPVPVSDWRGSGGRQRDPGPDASGTRDRHGHVDQLQSASGKILTLSLSFNNDGPIGTFFRYICDNGTYLARYDDLFDGHDKRSTFPRWTSR